MQRVLVAEDEPALLESFCELVRNLGHECVAAQDGNQALELARTRHPQLIIADLMMPGRTGIDLIRALRQELALSRVPVILLSAGRPTAAEQKEAWRFLPKPISVDALESAVRDALEQRGQAESPQSYKAAPDVQLSPIA
jgi:CheY-like chemotaxis protein